MNARRLRELAQRLAVGGPDPAPGAGDDAMIVQVLETRGSAPREAGACMLVRSHDSHGTIGGGHLEWQAIGRARAHLDAAARTGRPGRGASGWIRESVALGPSLGQCCGGAVVLGYRRLDAGALAEWPVPAPLFHLHLYGAGHVGRALVRQLALLDVIVDWFDERDAMFAQADADPCSDPGVATIRRHCVDGLDAEARAAPAGVFHLVATHAHDLDLRIVEAILARDDHAWCGLIGSRTKRVRFERRLAAHGIGAEALARMTCPIGIGGVTSKSPELIALAVAAQMAAVALDARACGASATAGRTREPVA